MFAWSNVFLSVDDILVSFNDDYSGLFISPLANNAYTLSLEMIDSSFLCDIPKYIGFIFSQIHAHTSPRVCQKTHMETCWFILQWKRDTSQLHECCGGNKLNLRVKLIFMYYIVMCWVNLSDLWLIMIHFIISSLIKFFFLFPKQLILVPTWNPEWYVGLIDWFFFFRTSTVPIWQWSVIKYHCSMFYMPLYYVSPLVSLWISLIDASKPYQIEPDLKTISVIRASNHELVY